MALCAAGNASTAMPRKLVSLSTAEEFLQSAQALECCEDCMFEEM
ncbi:hypothetical protein A2U01_0017181 [Trifolium medium]|uniref:Uncharacterized protein n=1 Tax=Trifolium medium TaxID=97028 RepID=A0A392NAX0_9FABA|nr:hypothetical protein [Trifolium medium]